MTVTESSRVSRPGEHTSRGFVIVLSLAAAYLCYLLVAPFLRSILLAAVLAVLCFPLHRWFSGKIRNRNAAALVSTLTVVLLSCLVAFFLGRTLFGGIKDVYDSLAVGGENRERLSAYLLHLLEKAAEIAGRYLPMAAADLRSATAANAEKWLSALLGVLSRAAGSATSSLANLGIAFFILFFLFRDGRAMLRRLFAVVPLARRHSRRLLTDIRDVLHAIVYGTLFIAVLQGVLTGIAFWALGIASPALWAVVTGLCALLPVIGTTIVILPAISMLIVGGHWVKAIILLIWGGVVVHPVDNFLRPYLIGSRTRLSTLFVFFSLVGGAAAFGAVGLFVGPVVLATTLSLFQVIREETHLKQGIGGGRP